MKRWSIGWTTVLLLTVVIANAGYDPIASLYSGDQLRAARSWERVLYAFEAMVLYLWVWVHFPWKPVWLRYAAALVCAWGFLEKLQVAGCRLAFPMNLPPPDTPLYMGLCDLITGWPIYMLTLLLVVGFTALRMHHVAGTVSGR